MAEVSDTPKHEEDAPANRSLNFDDEIEYPSPVTIRKRKSKRSSTKIPVPIKEISKNDADIPSEACKTKEATSDSSVSFEYDSASEDGSERSLNTAFNKTFDQHTFSTPMGTPHIDKFKARMKMIENSTLESLCDLTLSGLISPEAEIKIAKMLSSTTCADKSIGLKSAIFSPTCEYMTPKIPGKLNSSSLRRSNSLPEIRTSRLLLEIQQILNDIQKAKMEAEQKFCDNIKTEKIAEQKAVKPIDLPIEQKAAKPKPIDLPIEKKRLREVQDMKFDNSVIENESVVFARIMQCLLVFVVFASFYEIFDRYYYD